MPFYNHFIFKVLLTMTTASISALLLSKLDKLIIFLWFVVWIILLLAVEKFLISYLLQTMFVFLILIIWTNWMSNYNLRKFLTNGYWAIEAVQTCRGFNYRVCKPWHQVILFRASKIAIKLRFWWMLSEIEILKLSIL